MEHFPPSWNVPQPASPQEAERFLGLRAMWGPTKVKIVAIVKDDQGNIFALMHASGGAHLPTHGGEIDFRIEWKVGKQVENSYGHYWLSWSNVFLLDPVPKKTVQLTLF